MHYSTEWAPHHVARADSLQCILWMQKPHDARRHRLKKEHKSGSITERHTTHERLQSNTKLHLLLPPPLLKPLLPLSGLRFLLLLPSLLHELLP